MAAVTMIDRLVEAGLAEILATSVTGFTYHLSQDLTEKKPPFLAIRATIASETPVPKSGVFEIPVEIIMAARADDIGAETFNQKSAQLLQAFYHDTSTVSRLNATTAMGSAFAYRVDVEQSQNDVDSEERMFMRTINLTVVACPNSIAS
jgi:hypothetical protein